MNHSTFRRRVSLFWLALYPFSTTRSYGKHALLLCLLLGGVMPVNGQIYYIQSDNSATTRNDQLWKIDVNGSNKTQVATNFADSPGVLALDKTTNKAFVAEARATVTPKVISIDLTSGASTTVTSFANGTGCQGIALDPINQYIYYAVGDGSFMTTNDQIRRVNYNGTGDQLIVSNYVNVSGPLSIDLANNRLFAIDSRATASKIVAINLSTNGVTTVLNSTSLVTGITYDSRVNKVYYTISDQQATTSIDQLRRIDPGTLADELVLGNFSANTPGNIALDKTNNLIIVADVRGTAPEILKVDLSNSTSSTVTTIANTVALTGIAVLPTCSTFVTTLTPSPSGTLTCAQTSLTLTATGGNRYTFARTNGGGILSQSTSGSAIINTSGTYSVTVTDVDGCTMVNTTTISSNTAPPTASISTPGNQTTLNCTTTTLALSASGGGTYRWDNNTTNAVRNVTVANTYSVTVTGTNGCTATASTSISSDTAVPTVSVSPSSGTLTCSVTSLTLTASGSTATYRWTGGSTANTLVVNTAGTYSVTATGANGCTATASSTIIQNGTPPTASLTASGTITCAVPAVTLTASGGNTYTFSGPGVVASSGNSATVNAGGVYSVTVTNTATGCSSTTTVSVQSDNTPPGSALLTASNSGTLTCAVTTLTLTANATGTGLNYAFSGPAGSIAGSGNTRSISATGTYSVTITGSNGCTATTTTTISSNTTAPTVSIGPSSGTLTCAVTSLTLTATGSTATYRWTGGTTGNTLVVNTAGTYSVTATTPSGCTATASTTISSDTAVPTVSVSPSSGTLTCSVTSLTLTASGTSSSYRWTDGTTGSTLVVNTAGTYSVTATGANGCTATASSTIIQNGTPPTASLTASGTITCAVPMVTLTASGGNSYIFSGPGLVASSGNSATVNAGGLYSVTVTNTATGCSSTTTVSVQSNTTAPTVGVSPTSGTLTCSVTSLTLTASGSTATYRWTGGSTANALVVNTAGTYSVTATDPSGCTATTSATVSADQTPPTVSINGNTTFCQGQTSQLTAIGNGSIRWSTGDTSPTTSVTTAGNYSVTLTASNGCTNVASQLVTAVSCSTAAPTTCGSPANTIGQTLVITGVTDINCTTGSFRILTTGGNGQLINFAGIVGLSNMDPYNCVRRADGPDLIAAINNSGSDIGAFGLRGMQVNGSTSNTFAFDFKGYCATNPPSSTTSTPPSSTTSTPSPAGCGSMSSTIGQVFMISGVTDVNCSTGAFRILTTGGTGQPINFAGLVGLSNVDPYNCVRMVDSPDLGAAINNPNSSVGPFSLRGIQVGGSTSNTYVFDFKGYCVSTNPPSSTTSTPPSSTTSTPPTPVPTTCGSPTNTLGQPLVITGVTDVSCATGSFRILTTGGNGQPINYAGIVGLNSMAPYDCVRMVDGPDLIRAINDPGSDISPFGLRGVQVGGSTSNTFSFNFKQFCTGAARRASNEASNELEVTVVGNPTLGERVEVIIANTNDEPVELWVVDAQGQIVSEQTAQSVGSTIRQRVLLGRLSGVYLLRVSTATRTKTVRIIRQ